MENVVIPLVSIVIVAWNRCEDISDSTYINLEVLVCDNGSTDGTGRMIKEEFPDVRIIEIGCNIGIGAFNIGFRSSRGQYIVAFDDDYFTALDALNLMVKKFEHDDQLGIVAFDVRNYYNYDNVAIFDESQREKNTVTTEGYLMGFNGAGVGVRREVFEEAGYYPEDFFLYMNEPDFAIRVLQAGYTIKFFSDIVSYHKFSPSNRTSWRAPFYYCRNSFWLVWKHYPLKFAILYTVKLVCLVTYHSVEQHTFIYLKAMLAALWKVVHIAKIRNPVSPKLVRDFRPSFELAFTFYR